MKEEGLPMENWNPRDQGEGKPSRSTTAGGWGIDFKKRARSQVSRVFMGNEGSKRKSDHARDQFRDGTGRKSNIVKTQKDKRVRAKVPQWTQ